MIGAARDKSEIFEPFRTPDVGGGALISWTLLEAIWVDVEQLRATRDYGGDRRRLVRRIAATTQTRSGVSVGHRLRWRGVDYDIVSIETSDSRDRRMVLIGEEAML